MDLVLRMRTYTGMNYTRKKPKCNFSEHGDSSLGSNQNRELIVKLNTQLKISIFNAFNSTLISTFVLRFADFKYSVLIGS